MRKQKKHPKPKKRVRSKVCVSSSSEAGIAAVYIANTLMEKAPQSEVVIVSDEKHPPYDRIHLCKLVEDCNCVESIELELNPKVTLELDQKIVSIDREQRRIFSEHAAFHYDKLIIATGSIPKSLFDISGIENAATFRSQKDCENIAKGMVGAQCRHRRSGSHRPRTSRYPRAERRPPEHYVAGAEKPSLLPLHQP
jgi:NAD(P)H-nitrite reductase large subunit